MKRDRSVLTSRDSWTLRLSTFPFRMPLFAIFLLTADVSADINTKCQHMLLLAVFQDIRRDFKAKLLLNPPFKDTLYSEDSWLYVDSVKKELHLQFNNPDGMLHKFSANLLEVGDFRIRWMPPAVCFLKVSNSKQCYEVETRCLPREARELNLNTNFIIGSIDLQALPNHIICFAMQKNKLTGRISLERLPLSLERLELQENPFKKQVLYYSDLPKTLKRVYLINTKLKAVPVAEEFDTEEKRKIFYV